MRRGFTMIEMLLATVLVGVLTTFSVLTFRSVSHGWQVSADYLDKMQRTDYALNQVVSGLRSMYYPHDGSQNSKYGFMLTNNGDGEDPRRSDVIEWSKLGSAIVGTKDNKADSVHRVQVMVLEEGDNDYAEPIQKTGLYARVMRDSALGVDKDEDDTDLTFGNAELYQCGRSHGLQLPCAEEGRGRRGVGRQGQRERQEEVRGRVRRVQLGAVQGRADVPDREAGR